MKYYLSGKEGPPFLKENVQKENHPIITVVLFIYLFIYFFVGVDIQIMNKKAFHPPTFVDSFVSFFLLKTPYNLTTSNFVSKIKK